MPWVRHDADRATHHKLRRAGLAARGLEDAVMEQMAKDGVRVVRGLAGLMGKPNRAGDAYVDTQTVLSVAWANGAPKRQALQLAALLVKEDRWEPDGDGWWVLDYLVYNYTAEEWDAVVSSRRHAGVASGASRRTHVERPLNGSTNGSSNTCSTGGRTDVATDVEPLTLSLSTSTKENTLLPAPRSAAEDPLLGFDEFWSAYPERNGKRLGRGKCELIWRKLKLDDRRAAFRGARNYAASIVSGLVLSAKDPERWLRDRCWTDWQEPATATRAVTMTHREARSFGPDGEPL